VLDRDLKHVGNILQFACLRVLAALDSPVGGRRHPRPPRDGLAVKALPYSQ
jgi:hypothetical protein